MVDLRTLPPPFLWQSPSVERDREWKWWWNNLTVSLVYLAVWAEDGQAIPQERLCFELWFFSNCSAKQPSGQFYLDLDWHWLLWINAHGNGILNIFHRLSTPPVIIFKESHHFFKLFCFFAMVIRFGWILSLFESRYWSIIVDILFHACFCWFTCLFYFVFVLMLDIFVKSLN